MDAFIDSFQLVYGPQILNGLAIGVAVILMALGLTIIFGLLDVIKYGPRRVLCPRRLFRGYAASQRREFLVMPNSRS
jgi:hypothetical protein